MFSISYHGYTASGGGGGGAGGPHRETAGTAELTVHTWCAVSTVDGTSCQLHNAVLNLQNNNILYNVYSHYYICYDIFTTLILRHNNLNNIIA